MNEGKKKEINEMEEDSSYPRIYKRLKIMLIWKGRGWKRVKKLVKRQDYLLIGTGKLHETLESFEGTNKP